VSQQQIGMNFSHQLILLHGEAKMKGKKTKKVVLTANLRRKIKLLTYSIMQSIRAPQVEKKTKMWVTITSENEASADSESTSLVL